MSTGFEYYANEQLIEGDEPVTEFFTELSIYDILHAEKGKQRIEINKENGIYVINYNNEFEEELWSNELHSIADFCKSFLKEYEKNVD